MDEAQQPSSLGAFNEGAIDAVTGYAIDKHNPYTPGSEEWHEYQRGWRKQTEGGNTYAGRDE